MMRALYTAATGMAAQQLNMDVISNNLANVNTIGFKSSRADFQDTLYQEQRLAGTPGADGVQSPTGIEIGLGVRPGATVNLMSEGSFENTGNTLDVAVQGNGFFKVLLPDGGYAYTRDGSFQLDSQGQIVNSDGYAIQPEITIPANASQITIGTDGTVSVIQGTSTTPTTIGKIGLTMFSNPGGLEQIGGNNFQQTNASGAPVDGTAGQEGYGTLAQGTLEQSNVSIVNEMVNMIVAQRAYEVNSKAIQTADSMLSTANQLAQAS